MAKIYLSSTFSDLQKHRQAVYRVLNQLSHDVLAMENGVARNDRPLDVCLRDVTCCDVYIGIFAWRYGYIPGEDNPEQRSITECEYRRAEESSKPCLIFLLDENASWPPTSMDSYTNGDREWGQRIKALRKELEGKKYVDFFRSSDDLATKVSVAVTQQFSSPRPAPVEPTVALRLPMVSNFDLNKLVDACMEKMPSDQGLVGIGIPCDEFRLLKNFCERLKDEIGRGQTQVRDPLKIDPLINSISDAVAVVRRYRSFLKSGDVICQIIVHALDGKSYERCADFWRALHDEFRGPFNHRLIVVMGFPGGGFPEGIIELPSPAFTDEHISCFIRDIVRGLDWPMDCVVRWKRMMIDECRVGDGLGILMVYEHIDYVLHYIRGKSMPRVDAFLADLERRRQDLV
jgi:hypothetical protein